MLRAPNNGPEFATTFRYNFPLVGGCDGKDKTAANNREIGRRVKLAFCCLLTSVGIPMILAGDEFADENDLFGITEAQPIREESRSIPSTSIATAQRMLGAGRCWRW